MNAVCNGTDSFGPMKLDETSVCSFDVLCILSKLLFYFCNNSMDNAKNKQMKIIIVLQINDVFLNFFGTFLRGYLQCGFSYSLPLAAEWKQNPIETVLDFFFNNNNWDC